MDRLGKAIQQDLIVVRDPDLVQGDMAVDKALLMGIIKRSRQRIEDIGGRFQIDNTVGPP